MAQDSKQNSNESFVSKNRTPITVAVIIIILLGIYLASRGNNVQEGQGDQNNDQKTEQTEQKNNSESKDGQKQEAQKPQTETKPADSTAASDSLIATGTLQPSDNAAKGNVVIQSNRGKIYLRTNRDYTKLYGKTVTMSAKGSITGFTDAIITEGTTPATGSVKGATTPTQPSTEANTVTFSGTLAKSDDNAKGNYVITSGKTRVYLQTSKDYTAWTGNTVTLSAKGTLANFTSAKLSK